MRRRIWRHLGVDLHRQLPLQSVGALPERSLAVLKIYTPLRRVRSDKVFAVAKLYFSARSVREPQARAQSAASERLRLDASLANEHVLAEEGVEP